MLTNESVITRFVTLIKSSIIEDEISKNTKDTGIGVVSVLIILLLWLSVRVCGSRNNRIYTCCSQGYAR